MYAAENKGPHGVEIMEGLVRNGADVKAKDNCGVHTLYSHPQNIYLSLSTLNTFTPLYMHILPWLAHLLPITHQDDASSFARKYGNSAAVK